MSPTSEFSTISRAGKATTKPILEIVAPEIKDQIFSHLSQETLYCLLLTGPALSEAAAVLMYRCPRFPTTYRFAQFVTTVSHSRRYADMVRDVKISDAGKEENRVRGLAEWREWKFRTEPLYAAQLATRQYRETTQNHFVTHPECNQLLTKWGGDVALGAILHVLAACKNIRHFDLQHEVLTDDFVINSAAHPPTAFTSMIFVSDVPRSWTRPSADIKQIKANTIIEYLTNLPQIESIYIRKAMWLTTEHVQDLLFQCPLLEKLDFRHSGTIVDDPNFVLNGKIIKDDICWAIKGSKEKVAAKLTAGLIGCRGGPHSESDCAMCLLTKTRQYL